MPRPPLPKSDLNNISSKDHLDVWDDYVCAVLQGLHAFHGASSNASTTAAANYAATLADKMMNLRQERAQGHIDQKIEEKEAEKKKAARK